MESKEQYAFRARLDMPYEEALTSIGDALKTEGFGILTSIDMQATLREKLDAEFRKYSILGVCNPPLAQRALGEDLDAGLVLPCTVVIYEEGDGSEITIADPMAVVNLLDNLALQQIAKEAQTKLKRVLDVVKGKSAV